MAIGAALFMSSILSGLAATTIMLVFLYLPLLWGGVFYDSLGAAGALVYGKVDGRSRLLGTLFLFIGGILFAFFYGWFVLLLTLGTFPAPEYVLFPTSTAPVNLFFPLFGLVMGLGQGIYLSLITTFIVTDFHPIPSYRNTFALILSYLIGHMVYGVTVMFFQAQVLGLLL